MAPNLGKAKEESGKNSLCEEFQLLPKVKLNIKKNLQVNEPIWSISEQNLRDYPIECGSLTFFACRDVLASLSPFLSFYVSEDQQIHLSENNLTGLVTFLRVIHFVQSDLSLPELVKILPIVKELQIKPQDDFYSSICIALSSWSTIIGLPCENLQIDDVIKMEPTAQWSLESEKPQESFNDRLPLEMLEETLYNFGFKDLSSFEEGTIQWAICSLLQIETDPSVTEVRKGHLESFKFAYNKWSKNNLNLDFGSSGHLAELNTGVLLLNGHCISVPIQILCNVSSIFKQQLTSESSLGACDVTGQGMSADQWKIFLDLLLNPNWSFVWRLCPNTKDLRAMIFEDLFQSNLENLQAVLLLASKYEVNSLVKFLYSMLQDHVTSFHSRFSLAIANDFLFACCLAEITSKEYLSKILQNESLLTLIPSPILVKMFNYLLLL